MAIQSATSPAQSYVAATYAAQQQTLQVNEQQNAQRKQAEESQRQSETVTLSQDAQRLQGKDTRTSASESRAAEGRNESAGQQQAEQTKSAQQTRIDSSRSYAQAIAAYRETSVI